ncbi:centriolar and ciliogenesis-associated protein HYLS1 [Dromaius novaehollandiae]
MEEMMAGGRYGWAALTDEERLAGAAALALSQLYAEQGDGDGRPGGAWPLPHYDPYTKASVAPGARPAFPAPSTGPRRLAMKRKVLRRRPDGGVEVSDESVASEADAGGESEPEVWDRREESLQLGAAPGDGTSEGETESGSSFLSEPSPELYRRPPFLLGDFQGSPSSRQDATGHPKSFIPPRLDQPGRNHGKTDRVAKYLEYKRDWEAFPIPGEDGRKELRWAVRERMLGRAEEPSRPRRAAGPNGYVAPTEKKRAALRWQVRCRLADGLVPAHGSSS